MIPLLVLAIALGTAAAAYERSPRARAWTDRHVIAMRDLVRAHGEAHVKLAEARAAKDPTTAVQLVHEATRANQAAAAATAEAAAAAGSDQERATAASSAEVVARREAQIAEALEQLGVGECSVHAYPRVTAAVRDALLRRLHAEGMAVTGDNPWEIDTKKHGVKLRALWDSRAEELRLIVTAGKGNMLGLVTCDAIWGEIDPIMKEVIGA